MNPLLSSRATMLRRLLVLLILISAVSCAPGIYAKTDCDRWLAQYKQALLQKRAVQRAAAAKRRLQRKIVGYVAPSPAKPVTRRPVLKRRMSPLEALNHFQLACGDLEPTGDDTGLLPVAFNGLPAFDLPEFPYTPTDASPLVAGVVPPETIPPVVDTPVGSTPTFPGPVIGTPPVTVVTPPPVTPVVPEPSSIVLVMTGIGAAVAAGRRRLGR